MKDVNHLVSEGGCGLRAGREQALGRLLDYYQHTAALAQALLARQGRPGPPLTAPAGLLAVPVLGDAGQALAWERADRDNLLACLDHVTRAGQHARVVALTAAVAELLRRDGPWAEAITRHGTALQAARHLSDRPGQAGALTNLGAVRRLTGDYPGATRDLEQALALYRDLSDQLGQANALTNLGFVRLQTSDYPGATRDLEQALALYRDLSNQLGQADALTHLGNARRLTSDYLEAARDLEQALVLYRDLSDQLGQAGALTDLGNVRYLTSDWPGATRDLNQALALYRDLGDRFGQANALFYLGAVQQMTGDYPGATRDLEQALALYRDLGNRLGQANALTYLGVVRRQVGDYPGATRDMEQALAGCGISIWPQLLRCFGSTSEHECGAEMHYPSGRQSGVSHVLPPTRWSQIREESGATSECHGHPGPVPRPRPPARPGERPWLPRCRAAAGRRLPRGHPRPRAGPGPVPRPQRPGRRGHGAQ